MSCGGTLNQASVCEASRIALPAPELLRKEQRQNKQRCTLHMNVEQTQIRLAANSGFVLVTSIRNPRQGERAGPMPRNEAYKRKGQIVKGVIEGSNNQASKTANYTVIIENKTDEHAMLLFFLHWCGTVTEHAARYLVWE